MKVIPSLYFSLLKSINKVSSSQCFENHKVYIFPVARNQVQEYLTTKLTKSLQCRHEMNVLHSECLKLT